MDQMDRKRLLEAFPPAAIKKRQGGGGRTFDYVSGGDVIRRLIDATANDYAWSVTRLEFVSDGKAGFWLCEGKLELPGLGIRHGVGTHQAMDLESPKSAETDALKRAARLFGVALQLYEDDAPAAAPAPAQRQTAPAPPVENAHDLAARARSELTKMGVEDLKTQNLALVRLYGSKPEKWTADVYRAILARPGAAWRKVVDDVAADRDVENLAVKVMDNLAAAGKGHEHEPT